MQLSRNSFHERKLSRSFYISGSFFKNVGGFLHFTDLASCLVTSPSWNENQQCKLQVRARTFFSVPSVCQCQQMIDQSWDLNSDHLCSYVEWLPSSLMEKKIWKLFILEIIQISFKLINLHFVMLLWLELPSTTVCTIQLEYTVDVFIMQTLVLLFFSGSLFFIPDNCHIQPTQVPYQYEVNMFLRSSFTAGT